MKNCDIPHGMQVKRLGTIALEVKLDLAEGIIHVPKAKLNYHGSQSMINIAMHQQNVEDILTHF